MSKMGQFVFECQEVACENYNEPVDFMISSPSTINDRRAGATSL